MYAAQHGIPRQVPIRRHQYDLAFALTDFKLQGRTLPKLIISICTRSRMPWMTLQSFYVLVSRTTSMKGLRLLQNDPHGLENVRQQMPDKHLFAWERGYDQNGQWSDDLAVTALQNIRASRTKDNQKSAKRHREQPFTTNQNSPAKTILTPGSSSPSPNKRQKQYQCSLCKSTEHRKSHCHLRKPKAARALFNTPIA